MGPKVQTGSPLFAAARRIVAEVPGAGRLLGGAVAWGLLSSLATVVWAEALATAVARVFLGHASLAGVTAPLAWGVAATGARAAGEWGARRVRARLSRQVKASLKGRLVGQLFALGPAFQREVGAAQAVQAVMEGADAVAVLVGTYLPQMVLALAVPVLVLVAVGVQFWLAGLILLVTGPMVPLFMALIGRAAEARSRSQWDHLLRLGRHFLDLVEGLGTLRLTGQSRRQLPQIARVSENYRRSVMATLRLALLSAFALELLAAIATALVAVAVGFALLAGRLPFGPALAVLILTPEFYLPQRSLGAAFHQAMDALVAYGLVARILNAPPPGGAGGRTIPSGGPPWRIQAVHLTFAHPGQGELLKGLSFSLAPGEHLAVVGPSGSGKTTLVHLILGLLRPQRGSVTVNGYDLAELDPGWWRRQVGLLPQTPYLAFGSVRDNLCQVRPGATDRALWEALERADAARFVAALPGRLDAPIGDRGLRLSGGQAQRLALARLFLADPALVVLDEPTEHLDPIARAQVWSALDPFLKGRSLLLVTHRPEEAARADRTLRLQGAVATPLPVVVEAPGR